MSVRRKDKRHCVWYDKNRFRDWEDIPAFMRSREVRPYYDILDKKRTSLKIKRLADIIISSILLIIFAFPMCVIAVFIRLDSGGPVFFRQERVTAYGRTFWIHKFRTMKDRAEGASVTVSDDRRITKVGRILRRNRLDELPQLFDVLAGEMSLVGTRPELKEYVKQYTKEMYATLLMPAGITSEASIRYKDESCLLGDEKDADTVYVQKILPDKMARNLYSIRRFGLQREFWTCIRTFLTIIGKNMSDG